MIGSEEELQELCRLRQTVQELQRALEKQRIQIENLTQALLHARKKIFGRSSEAAPVAGQTNLFAQEELISGLVESRNEIVVTEHKRKARQPGVRADMIAKLPVEVIRCEIEEEATCPKCASELVKIGEKVVRSEVVYEPAILKVIQYVQEVKKCKACGGKGSANPSDVFVQAKVPRPVLMHSLASASLVAGVMYKKYDMGIPLARQERDWMRLGLETYRSTLANWVIRCSEEWLTPLYNRMHKKMLASEILQGDETRIQCNREPGKKAGSESYMWVMRTGNTESIRAVIFHYARTRSGEEAKTLYEGFKGYLVTDAYAGYEKVESIRRALCWSHVRRYYLDSIPLDSRGKEIAGSKGAEGRAWCDRLFQIEQKLKGCPPQERAAKRLELSRPVLEGFWSWVSETSAKLTPNESLRKALQYSINQKKYLETFLEDGRIPISNIECEACIRPFANGRKAWLFADSPEGAKANGVVYSLVETAKLNHLDVFRYLTYLLEHLPQLDFFNHPDLLDDYLPWSGSLPASCRLPNRKNR